MRNKNRVLFAGGGLERTNLEAGSREQLQQISPRMMAASLGEKNIPDNLGVKAAGVRPVECRI